MNVRTNPSPRDYIEFAKLDLGDGRSSRNLVNALSNVKRALHLRMEDLCIGFGAVDLRKLNSFPVLAEYIRKCGIVAPRVLDRLNKLRNTVEHAYAIPDESEVETFIDVAELFLAATNRWIDRQPVDVEFDRSTKDRSGNYLLDALRFNWSKGEAALYWVPVGPSLAVRTTSQTYSSGDEKFFACIRFALANDY